MPTMELPADSVLGEPCKRDTAPAIGLAALQLAARDPEAVMAVMPSDHVIGTDAALQDAIRFAADLVMESPGRLVTFYDFAEINRAAADAVAGTTIKPVLRITS